MDTKNNLPEHNPIKLLLPLKTSAGVPGWTLSLLSTLRLLQFDIILVLQLQFSLCYNFAVWTFLSGNHFKYSHQIHISMNILVASFWLVDMPFTPLLGKLLAFKTILRWFIWFFLQSFLALIKLLWHWYNFFHHSSIVQFIITLNF